MKQCRVLCVPSVFCRHSTRESKVSELLIICVISFLLLFSSRFINPTKPREEETTSAELEQFYFLEGEIKACFEWIGVFPLHRVSFIQTKADNFIVAYRKKKQETIEWRSSQVRRRRRLKRVMWYVLCSRWWRNVINIEPNLVLEVKSSNRYTYKALCAILKESLANKSKNNNNERSRQFWVFHSCDLCPHKQKYSTNRVSSKNNNTNWFAEELYRVCNHHPSIHPSSVEWQHKKKRNAIHKHSFWMIRIIHIVWAARQNQS